MFHLIKNNSWENKDSHCCCIHRGDNKTKKQLIYRRSCQTGRIIVILKAKHCNLVTFGVLQDLLSSAVRCCFLDQLVQPVTDKLYCAIVSSHLPQLHVSFPVFSILKHSFSSRSGHYTLVCNAGVTEPPSSCCPVTNNSLTHNIVILFVC